MIKTPGGPALLLRAAAASVTAALEQLDSTDHGCPTCGCRVLSNFTEGRTHEQLAELPQKLVRAASRIEYAMRLDAAKEERA